MAGEKHLKSLLSSISPVLNKGTYVFCSLPDSSQAPAGDIVMLFKEAEGYTLILEKANADRLKLLYDFEAAWITLTVHSSLEATGLTAAFSKALSDANISCNVVAGYFHDHLFVPVRDAERALQVLRNFSRDSG